MCIFSVNFKWIYGYIGINSKLTHAGVTPFYSYVINRLIRTLYWTTSCTKWILCALYSLHRCVSSSYSRATFGGRITTLYCSLGMTTLMVINCAEWSSEVRTRLFTAVVSYELGFFLLSLPIAWRTLWGFQAMEWNDYPRLGCDAKYSHS